MRRAVDPGDVGAEQGLPVFDFVGAYRLYTELLQPVASGWKGAASLLVAANGAMSQVPPAMLPTASVQLENAKGARYAPYRAVPWLIREAAVTQIPSVNSLVALRRLPAASLQRRTFIGFGDPEFGSAAPATGSRRVLRNLVGGQLVQAPGLFRPTINRRNGRPLRQRSPSRYA